MATQCRGSRTWQDRCALSLRVTAHRAGISAQCTHPCSSVIKNIFALDNEFMAAPQLDSSPPSSQYQWSKMHECTRGFCAVEQHKLLLAYHDCRAARTQLSQSRSCHATSVISRPRLRLPPSQFILPKRNTPTCGEKQKYKPTLHISRLHSLHDIRVLAIDC